MVPTPVGTVVSMKGDQEGLSSDLSWWVSYCRFCHLRSFQAEKSQRELP